MSVLQSQKRGVAMFTKSQVEPIRSASQQLPGPTKKITRRRRRLRIALMTLMCLIAITGLIVLTTLDSIKASKHSVKIKTLQTSVKLSMKIANLVHRLQIERGTRVLHVSSGGAASTRKKVLDAQDKTDQLAQSLDTWPRELTRYQFNSKDTFMTLVSNHRKLHKIGNSTIESEIRFYSKLVSDLSDWLFQNVPLSDYDILSEFIGYQTLLAAKEKTGIERALGGTFFIQGQFKEKSELLWFAEHCFIGKEKLAFTMQLLPDFKRIYNNCLEARNKTLLSQIEDQRKLILNNEKQNASAESGIKWFQLMTTYIDAILDSQNEIGVLILDEIERYVSESENDLILKLSVIGFVVLLLPSFVHSVYTIQEYAVKLHQATSNLKEEKQRADTLLYQMLPLQVAEQLKSGLSVKAEQFESVTVFFSDIVNFTEICANISPMEVTQMLNRLYGLFDNHIDKYDVYKVETIGDAYMVVSGLPDRNGHNHVAEIAVMSLHLVELLKSLATSSEEEQDLCMRIGIHTGKLKY